VPSLRCPAGSTSSVGKPVRAGWEIQLDSAISVEGKQVDSVELDGLTEKAQKLEGSPIERVNAVVKAGSMESQVRTRFCFKAWHEEIDSSRPCTHRLPQFNADFVQRTRMISLEGSAFNNIDHPSLAPRRIGQSEYGQRVTSAW